MQPQQTIRRQITIHGVNVYNGKKNSATFNPAPPWTGLAFRVNRALVPARINDAEAHGRAISVRRWNTRVRLVEHLLSAVYALGIDNLIIDIPDATCPTVENCAREYFAALQNERVTQDAPKKYRTYRPIKPLTITSPTGPDQLTISPSDGFHIVYRAGYPHLALSEQYFKYTFDEDAEINYANNVMDARSIAFLGNRALARAFLTLGKLGCHGITEQNYLIIGSHRDQKPLNPEGYGTRYDGDEFVRHKILDTIGTLALTGRRFRDTTFTFYKTGHAFDLAALQLVQKSDVFTRSCEVDETAS